MYLIIICFFNGSSHELPDPETPKICSCILAAHQGAWAMLTCLCICILANLKIAYGIAFACTLTFLIRVSQWHPLHEKIGAERTLLHVSQNVRCPKCILGVTCPHGSRKSQPRARDLLSEPASWWKAGCSEWSASLRMVPPIQVSCNKPSESNTRQYSQGKTCICAA